jgi:hypothetical protein
MLRATAAFTLPLLRPRNGRCQTIWSKKYREVIPLPESDVRYRYGKKVVGGARLGLKDGAPTLLEETVRASHTW